MVNNDKNDDGSKKNENARALGRLGGLKGGAARAAKLGKGELSAIGRRGASVRWNKMRKDQGEDDTLPEATHAGFVFGSVGCLIIKDPGAESPARPRRRVLTQEGMLAILGRSGRAPSPSAGGSADDTAPFLVAKNLQEFITPELRAAAKPILYKTGIKGAGLDGIAIGYESKILPRVCEVFVKARIAGKLLPQQEHIATVAQDLLVQLAEKGIEARVDDATGYRDEKIAEEIRLLVQKFVTPEIQPYVKLFKPEFFRGVYKLHDWEYQEGDTQGPRYVGKFIDNTVYKRLPVGMRAALRELNPTIDGRRKRKMVQFVTRDGVSDKNSGSLDLDGKRLLEDHILAVTAFMRAAKTKAEFWDLLDRAYPDTTKKQLSLFAAPPPAAIRKQ